MTLRSLAFLILTTLSSTVGFSQIAANLQYTKNPSCAGFCDGGASVGVSGGVAPYHFKWSNNPGVDTCTINVLCTGMHRVTVTDNGGSLPVTFTFSLTSPTPFNADTAGHGVATCFGTEITIKATGGTFPYTGTGTFNSPAGNYIYIVRDANGCKDSVSVSVSAAPKIKVSVTVLDTACFNGLAPVMVSATGGYGSYTGTGPQNVAGGIHYFYVYDSLGCSAIDTVMIPMFAKGTLNITADTSTVCSSDSAMICVTSPMFNNFLWNNSGGSASCMYAKRAGNYYVSAMDENRCRVESNRVQINIHPTQPVSVSVNGDTLRAYNAIGYQWLQDDLPIAGAVHAYYVAKQAGRYAVDITDTNGCHAKSTSIQITGIEDILDSQLAIYPNPSTDGMFRLSVAGSMVGSTADVYDITGKLVYQAPIMQINSTIALDAPVGVYLLRIQDGENTLMRKLVKQ